MVIDPIDTDHLFRFLHRLVLPSGGSGRVNMTSQVQEGPLQFQRLLSNLRLVSADITPRLRNAARKEGIRNATIDFAVVNEFDARRVRGRVAETKGKAVKLTESERRGGSVDVYAQSALVNYGTWVYLYYGLWFRLRPGRDFEIRTYAAVESPETRGASRGNEWDERFIAWNRLGKRTLQTWRKGDLEKKFLQHIRRAARETRKSAVASDRRAAGILKSLATLRSGSP